MRGVPDLIFKNRPGAAEGVIRVGALHLADVELDLGAEPFDGEPTTRPTRGPHRPGCGPAHRGRP